MNEFQFIAKMQEAGYAYREAERMWFKLRFYQNIEEVGQVIAAIQNT